MKSHEGEWKYIFPDADKFIHQPTEHHGAPPRVMLNSARALLLNTSQACDNLVINKIAVPITVCWSENLPLWLSSQTCFSQTKDESIFYILSSDWSYWSNFVYYCRSTAVRCHCKKKSWICWENSHFWESSMPKNSLSEQKNLVKI